MAFQKNAGSKEVYSIIPQNLNHIGIQEMVRKFAPEESSFLAIFKMGYDSYSWSHPDTGWQCYTEADDLLQGMIMEEVARKKELLNAKLRTLKDFSKFEESIYTMPGDEYYYYRVDDFGHIDVLLTGWGCQKPVVKRTAKVDLHTHVETFQEVCVSIVDFGERLANREFSLFIASTGKSVLRKTDEFGYYLVGKTIRVGAVFPLTDIVTGKKFSIEVVSGKSEYECDITEPQPSSIAFVENGVRQPAREFTMAHDGKTTQHKTDADGTFLLGDHLPEGSVYMLTDKETGKNFSCTIQQGIPVYEYDVTWNVESVSIAFVRDGERVPGRSFAMRTTYTPASGEMEDCGLFTAATDDDGLYSVGEHIEEGTRYHVIDQMSGREFDFEVVVGKQIYEFDVTKEIKYQLVNISFVANHAVLPHRAFTLQPQEGGSMSVATDVEGRYLVGTKVPVGTQYSVTDDQTGKAFTLLVEEGKDLYTFDVTQEPEKQVRIRILDVDGVIVPSLKVDVKMATGEVVTAETDAEGCVWIPVSKFVPGKEVKVSFSYDAKKK